MVGLGFFGFGFDFFFFLVGGLFSCFGEFFC